MLRYQPSQTEPEPATRQQLGTVFFVEESLTIDQSRESRLHLDMRARFGISITSGRFFLDWGCPNSLMYGFLRAEFSEFIGEAMFDQNQVVEMLVICEGTEGQG